MNGRLAAVLVAALVIVEACAAGAGPTVLSNSPVPVSGGSGNPTGTATPGTPVPGGTGPRIANADLKVRLVERFGPLWFCDPDFYPVARDDEPGRALQEWPQIASDADALAAIEGMLAIKAPATPSDAQKLAIYREWKALRAIGLQASGQDQFAFDYLAKPTAGLGEGMRSKGTIDTAGTISLTSETRAPAPICPICLARGQLVDTPLGPVAVERLGPGDPIWTRDAGAAVMGATVIALGSTAVPPGHEMIRLTLVDGRVVLASPGHRLSDGRALGLLRVGEPVEGAVIAGVERVPYDEPETFDVLPSGPTGTYSVGGVWLASTLRP